MRLRSLLQKLRPDILHTYLIHGNILGRIVGRLVGVPVIIGSELTIGQAGRLGKLATKLTNPLTDAVEVNSETGGRAVVTDLGVPAEKVEVVLPGLDLDAFSCTKNRSSIRSQIGVQEHQHLVLYIGRLRSVKGVEYGIKAFARAAEANPTLHLALAGDGEQRDYLENLAYDLGISKRATFLGERSDLPDVLSAADSVLMPSLREGFPRVAIEAMAASKPVIATKVCAIAEAIIHDNSGILVVSRDVPAMSTAINHLTGDSDLQARLGANARTRVENRYSAELYVARLDEMYSQWSTDKSAATAPKTIQDSPN